MCLKSYGNNVIEDAANKCYSNNSQLPQPMNQRENDDYKVAFVSLGIHSFAALDLNDQNAEGLFANSYGEPMLYDKGALLNIAQTLLMIIFH